MEAKKDWFESLKEEREKFFNIITYILLPNFIFGEEPSYYRLKINKDSYKILNRRENYEIH